MPVYLQGLTISLFSSGWDAMLFAGWILPPQTFAQTITVDRFRDRQAQPST